MIDQQKHQALYVGKFNVLFRVHLVILECMKQTHCVGYFMKIDLIVLQYLTIKIRHYELNNLQFQIWVLLVVEKWFEQKHFVRYSTNFDSVM